MDILRTFCTPLSVDVASMSNPNNLDYNRLRRHIVDHAMVSDTNSVRVL
jgi:hypothetical protein